MEKLFFSHFLIFDLSKSSSALICDHDDPRVQVPVFMIVIETEKKLISATGKGRERNVQRDHHINKARLKK